MAISTYAQLQTAIASYLHTSDLTSNIVDFITLAESRLNRRVRLLQQEVESTASYSGSSNKIQLPTGFIELLDLKIKKSTDTDYKYEQLIHIPSDRIQEKYTDTTGRPQYYTLRDQIEFERLPDTTYTLKMHYLKRWDIATDLTNWLLTNYPDAYLYGALIEAEPYLVNDQRLNTWIRLFEAAMEEIDEVDQRNRDDEVLSVSDLSAMSNNYTYDINKDA